MTSRSWKTRRWLAALGVLLVAGPLSAERRSTAVRTPVLATCLAAAGAELESRGGELQGLERALLLQTAAPPPDPRGRFGAFDGSWAGQWGPMEVEHLWQSVAPEIQLVVIRDGTLLRRGINFIDATGQVCGIVEEPRGADRLHGGRFLAHNEIEWWTEDCAYHEQVLVVAKALRYAVESSPSSGGRCPMVQAQYSEMTSVAPGPAGPLSLIGAQFSWRIADGQLGGVLRGPTTGWVGVVFGESPDMAGARVVLLRVQDGEPEGRGAIGGRRGPRFLDPADEPIRITAGRERDGATTVAFAVPLRSSHGPELAAGKKLFVSLAWSASDDWDHHSTRRGGRWIEL